MSNSNLRCHGPLPVFAKGFDGATSLGARRSFSEGGKPGDDIEKDMSSRSRGTNALELCIDIVPLKKRAQGKSGAGCTRSLVCSVKSTRVYSPQV
jgi:hypothetical protein